MSEDKQWVKVWVGETNIDTTGWRTMWPLRLDEPLPAPGTLTQTGHDDDDEPTYTLGRVRVTFAYDGIYLERFEVPLKPCVCGTKVPPNIRRWYVTEVLEVCCGMCRRVVESKCGRDDVIRRWNQDTTWDRVVWWLRKWNSTVGFWAWVGACWYAAVVLFGMAGPEWPQFPLYVSTLAAPIFFISWGTNAYLKRTTRGRLP